MASNPARGDFDPVPSSRQRVTISVAGALPSVDEAAALAVPVAAGAEPSSDLGTDAAHLAIAGFTGKTGQHLVIPGADGRALVAVGIGDADTVDLRRVRDVAADYARAVPQHLTLAVELPDGATAIAPADFAQMVVEGVLLARWRYFVGKGGDDPTLTSLTIVATNDVAEEVRAGLARGETIARAAVIARDLANCPATTLSAARMAEVAAELGPPSGVEVTVFDKDQLVQMGCGGLLGVNLGSVDAPRMIKTDLPARAPAGHLTLVGKGIMYDSGGIASSRATWSTQMKNDMTGAGAILAAMSALRGSAAARRSRLSHVHRQHAVRVGAASWATC